LQQNNRGGFAEFFWGDFGHVTPPLGENARFLHIFFVFFAIYNTKIDPKNLIYLTYGAEFGLKMFLSKK
jgi:hypothetical protein